MKALRRIGAGVAVAGTVALLGMPGLVMPGTPAQAAAVSARYPGQREFCAAYVHDYFSPSWPALVAASHDVRGASPRAARAFRAWRETIVLNAEPWTVQAAAVQVFAACGMRIPS